MSRVRVGEEMVDVSWQQLKEIDELAASLSKKGKPPVTREEAAEQYLAAAKPATKAKRAAAAASEVR